MKARSAIQTTASFPQELALGRPILTTRTELPQLLLEPGPGDGTEGAL
jgi:hypothetical protein